MCVVRLRLSPLRRERLVGQVIAGFLRVVSERGLTLGRLAWQAGAGQLPAGSGTVTVEAHGTAGAWERCRRRPGS